MVLLSSQLPAWKGQVVFSRKGELHGMMRNGLSLSFNGLGMNFIFVSTLIFCSNFLCYVGKH